MAKIYTKGNYFFIEKDNRLFEALSKEVLVKKLTPTSTVFYFSNINNWTNEGIDLVDMEDESGTAYTAATWEAFYIENTGKSNGGSSGEGLQGSNFWEAILNDTTTAYIYKGGLNGTDWQINRYDRSDNLAKTSATVSNNSGITTLTDAWTDRLTINYL